MSGRLMSVGQMIDELRKGITDGAWKADDVLLVSSDPEGNGYVGFDATELGFSMTTGVIRAGYDYLAVDLDAVPGHQPNVQPTLLLFPIYEVRV